MDDEFKFFNTLCIFAVLLYLAVLLFFLVIRRRKLYLVRRFHAWAGQHYFANFDQSTQFDDVINSSLGVYSKRVLVLSRALSFLYFFIIGCILLGTRNDDEDFLLFTYWNVLLLSLFYLCALSASLLGWYTLFKRSQLERRLQTQEDWSYWTRVLGVCVHMMYEIAGSTALFVTVADLAFLNEDFTFFNSINFVGVLSLCLEMVLNTMPIRFDQYPAVLAWGYLYLYITWFVVISAIVDDWPYRFLRTDTPQCFSNYFAMAIVHFCFFIVWYVTFKFVTFIRLRCFGLAGETWSYSDFSGYFNINTWGWGGNEPGNPWFSSAILSHNEQIIADAMHEGYDEDDSDEGSWDYSSSYGSRSIASSGSSSESDAGSHARSHSDSDNSGADGEVVGERKGGRSFHSNPYSHAGKSTNRNSTRGSGNSSSRRKSSPSAAFAVYAPADAADAAGGSKRSRQGKSSSSSGGHGGESSSMIVTESGYHHHQHQNHQYHKNQLRDRKTEAHDGQDDVANSRERERDRARKRDQGGYRERKGRTWEGERERLNNGVYREELHQSRHSDSSRSGDGGSLYGSRKDGKTVGSVKKKPSKDRKPLTTAGTTAAATAAAVVVTVSTAETAGSAKTGGGREMKQDCQSASVSRWGARSRSRSGSRPRSPAGLANPVGAKGPSIADGRASSSRAVEQVRDH